MRGDAAIATGRARILIAGGGFAALEVALALKALCEDRVDLTLVAPTSTFAYRPAAPVEAFDDGSRVSFDLDRIARDLSAVFYRASVVAVAHREQSVRLDSGDELGYDFLVLATGATTRIALPGALTFRDHRDVPRFRGVLDELGEGRVRRLVFAVPSRHAWPLPIYELALQSALYASKRARPVDISLVTPEDAPLEVFGTNASQVVADFLRQREVAFRGGCTPRSVCDGDALTLESGASIPADRVVTVPELQGPRISGVPIGWSGFVPTDSCGRVDGRKNVFAAGDVTAFPVKQGGLAAQQADAVAQTLAGTLGAPVKELHQTRILRARLLHGEGALVLRAELDPLGRATGSGIEHRETRHAPDLKVFGQYLTPYLSMYKPNTT